MSGPSADIAALSKQIAALSGLVEKLVGRISALERSPRTGVTAPPSSPPKGSKRKGKRSKPPSRIAVTTTTAPSTFPLAQALPPTGRGADRYQVTCVIPDATAGHVVGRQGRGLKQIADISGARVSAFSLRENAHDLRHVAIRGTELQLGEALVVLGKRIARKRVRTPRPKGPGKEPRAGKAQGPPITTSINPSADLPPARAPAAPLPPRWHGPTQRTPVPSNVSNEPVPRHLDAQYRQPSGARSPRSVPGTPMSADPASLPPGSPMDLSVVQTSRPGSFGGLHDSRRTARRGAF